MLRLVLVTVLFVATVRAQASWNPQDCGYCDRDACELPTLCEAGVTLDQCGCCKVCAKREFELCDHERIRSRENHGKCGENLMCELRNDLDENDPEEAVCMCTKKDALCGTDDVTYDNICQMAASSIKKGKKIVVKDKGPCNLAPKIVSKPDNAKDYEGGNVALICEATGWPIPAVEWIWTRVDGKIVYLPSDDLHISVNQRGGPERYQITGWLQIMEMEKQHEGDYTCIAQNDLGVEQATARVKIISNNGHEQNQV